MARTGQEVGAVQSIVETVILINEGRKLAMANKVIEACGGAVAGKKIAVLGVTFKPNTDDMRDAPSLVIISRLQAAGAAVVACDPQGAHEGAALLPDLIWNEDPYSAAMGADAVVLITEWNAFRGLDLDRLAECMKSPTFVDLLNVYSYGEMANAGLDYYPVGKGKAPTALIGAEVLRSAL